MLTWRLHEKAEFLYKVKAKLQNQFKAAEANGVPFAVILGTDELAEGKVKIKEMGLPEDHPEKEGVAVQLADLEEEVKARLRRKGELDEITYQAEGLRVIPGIEGEEKAAAAAAAEVPSSTTPAP